MSYEDTVARLGQQAEIERLKGQNDLLLLKVGCLESIRDKDKQLITELAGWMDSVPRSIDKREDLLQRARELSK